MKISEFQSLMRDLYFHQDSKLGLEKTFIWLVEEVGELARTLKEEKNLDLIKVSEEMADIIAWICSLSNLLDVDLERALIEKYPKKCIKCDSTPCQCSNQSRKS